MARKKGRDLFEVLGARASGGRSAPKPAPKQESGVSMALADLTGWLRGLVPQRAASSRSSSSSSRKASSSSPMRWGGLAVAGLAFAVFGLGFLIGRGTAGESGAEASELRTTASGPIEPEWLDPASWLSPEQEEERLSQYCRLLLYYPALERQQASIMARWLREQGLDWARLRQMRASGTQDIYFAVVCYTRDQSGADEQALIQTLDTPGFDPKWSQWQFKRIGS